MGAVNSRRNYLPSAAEAPVPAAKLHGACGSCRHSFKDGPDLSCRAHPPVASILMVPSAVQPGVMRPQVFTAFPIVQTVMWCGEFEGDPGVVS